MLFSQRNVCKVRKQGEKSNMNQNENPGENLFEMLFYKNICYCSVCPSCIERLTGDCCSLHINLPFRNPGSVSLQGTSKVKSEGASLLGNYTASP